MLTTPLTVNGRSLSASLLLLSLLFAGCAVGAPTDAAPDPDAGPDPADPPSTPPDDDPLDPPSLCGNGVWDRAVEFLTETCDDSASDFNAAATCTCDDGNPCTDDQEVGGSAETCDLACQYVDNTGQYGYTHCNDGDPCTIDFLVSGSPTECTVTCNHEEIVDCESICGDGIVDASGGEACDDGLGSPTPCPTECEDADPCVEGILIGNRDTCTAECNFVDHAGEYGWSTCDDGDPCTEDIVVSGEEGSCPIVCDHVDTSAESDEPDDAFTDTNCDGVDGEASRLLFVSPDGDDYTGTGALNNPFRSIGRALVQASGTADIQGLALDQGTYTDTVQQSYTGGGVNLPPYVDLIDGVGIYGGYDWVVETVNGETTHRWIRSDAAESVISVRTPVGEALVGLLAEDIASETVVERVTIEVGNGGDPLYEVPEDVSVYGVRADDAPGLVLRKVTILAGDGGDGSDGDVGPTGEPGGDGDPGGHAISSNGPTSTRMGGAGGVNASCPGEHTTGGQGGDGDATSSGCGNADGRRDGEDGDQAPRANATVCLGAGGDGGDCGHYGGRHGSPATTCEPDFTPASGDGGDGASSVGTVSSSLWIPGSGEQGEQGTHGVGGGGGGGGGSAAWNRTHGAGGGGGGAGSCGGHGGYGGLGGGGSFGIFAVGSGGAILEEVTVASGDGGDGGDGGPGGPGGQPGSGGLGGSGINPNEKSDGGNGGDGGDGSAGESGGEGGGGAGGVSYGLLACDGSLVTTGTNAIAAGAGGSAGSGGGQAAVGGSATDVLNVDGACP